MISFKLSALHPQSNRFQHEIPLVRHEAFLHQLLSARDDEYVALRILQSLNTALEITQFLDQ